MYDYAIYGGGPTGLILSYILSYNGYKVVLIEKENALGGCWRTEWLEGKYFSEHSPRVLFPNHNYLIKILENFGMDMTVELSQKSPSGDGLISVIKYTLLRLSLSDLVKLGFLFILRNSGQLTVTEWCNNNNISDSGKKALRTIAIVLANTPDKLLMSEIVEDSIETIFNGLISEYPSMSQFVNHDKWINIFAENITKMGVTVKMNSELVDFKLNDQKHIKSGILKDEELIQAKNHILTFPPEAFFRFMENSSVSNNWMSIHKLKKWMIDSYYASIGFQLHFTKKMKFPKEWCWSCDNDYNLIVIDISKFTNVISKDPIIKSVWSCTVVSTDNYVSKWNKTINQLDINTIINDCLKIIKVKPHKITLYPGLHKKYGKYISKDTAFSLGKCGTIPYKGRISNLYTVGPHNMPGITSIGKASNSAILFCKSHNIKIPDYLETQSYSTKILIILISFAFLIYYIYYFN